MPDDPYFTVEEIRARFPDPLSDDTKYPDETLEYWRAYVEERIEGICDVAFVERTVTGRAVSGNGGTTLELPNNRILTITDATDDGTDIDLSDAKVTAGAVYLPGGWTIGTQNLAVTYTHGDADGPPLAIKEAAMTWAREMAVKGPITERATQKSTEDGTINLATPGLFGSITGLPGVDEILAEYRYPSFVG